MAYYDPYAYQDPYGSYGGYDPYQTYEYSPPPEPSQDWVDVPKINRNYVRRIHKDVIQSDFVHLKSEQLYFVEAMVEYIDLNEGLVPKQDTGEKIDDKIVTSLKILNLPPSELSLSKDDKKHDSVVSGRSAMSPPMDNPQLSELFQRMLSSLERLADESEEESGANEEVTGEDEGHEGVEKENQSISNQKQDEQIEEETVKRVKIDVMEGNSVLLLMNGFFMIQKLQKFDVRVAVCRSDIIATEEDKISVVVPLGIAAVRFPQSFHQAVLQQMATKSSFSVPLVGEEGEEVGMVGLTITLVSIGQGVEVGISEDPGAYGKVNLIKTFTPEVVESIFDPTVHPRLAVTLMNMEPPLGMNSTSTEIIQRCLESKSSKGEEGALALAFKPRQCRWLEIAKELSLKYSKHSLTSGQSHTSTVQKESDILRCPRIENDPELDLLWRKLKRQCAQGLKEAEDVESKKNTLYEELEELLRQDKGEGWESEVQSEKSRTSEEDERSSKSSKRSSKKTTLKPSTHLD